MIGTDLVKDRAMLEAAYNDSEGVTADFNRNVLRVINEGLCADFVPEAFEHVAFFDEANSWIEMRLRANGAQTVRIDGANLEVRFADGEEIRTEISAKFTPRRRGRASCARRAFGSRSSSPTRAACSGWPWRAARPLGGSGAVVASPREPRRWSSRSLVRSRSAKASVASNAGVRSRGSCSASCSLNANEVVSSDRLTEALWGERPPQGSGKALQVHMSRLRDMLEPGRARGGSGGILVTRPPGYELRVEPGQLDLHRFEQAVGESKLAAEAGRPEEAAQALHEALSLWRGPALADLTFEGALQPDIARLEELRLAALEDRFEADLELGRHAGLIGELEAHIGEQPLRERPRGQLMLALYRSGRQAEALDAYREARRVLVEELGLEPGRRLKELERDILAQDPGLDLRPAEPAEEPAPGAPAPEGLVGRQAELGELLRLFEASMAGKGGLILVGGEPGIGKSRLAEALAGQASSRGAGVLVGRCWEAGGAPAYWPWVQVLRSYVRDCDPELLRSQAGQDGAQLATILPELRERLPGLSPAAAADSERDRFQLFDAVASFLGRAAAATPLALFMDDLHAADAPSLLLLRFMAAGAGRRADPDRRLLPRHRGRAGTPARGGAAGADPGRGGHANLAQGPRARRDGPAARADPGEAGARRADRPGPR